MKENRKIKETPKKEKTFEQREGKKKVLIYSLMTIACAICIYFIFAPSDDEYTTETQGFNATIPMPNDNELPTDKKTAYEQAQLEINKEERNRSIQDIASIFDREKDTEDLNFEYDNNVGTGNAFGVSGSDKPYQAIQNSNNIYRDINRNLGGFYDIRSEEENERLSAKIDELNTKIQELENKKSSVDEQMELIEKSYKIAAKYIPQNGQSQSQSTGISSGDKKSQIKGVNKIEDITVSGLPQETHDSIFLKEIAQPRNLGFHTAIGMPATMTKNTIEACIHEDATITNGQSIKIRVLEALQAGEIVIPRNNIVVGKANIQGERLFITIHTLEYGGMIIPVELIVYDSDGQLGIYIPQTMEQSAIKEITSNMGQNIGTSISLTQSAGQQIASDLSKSIIQGGSQYLAKKIGVVKIKLKAGYKIMLLPKD